MTQYGFYVNTEICTGCKACMTACMDRNDLAGDEKIRKVYEFAGGDYTLDENGAYANTAFAYYVSLTCQQCDNPACVAACPTGAMQKYADGIVRSDHEVCIGCGSCATACPYGHPFVSAELKKSIKCVLCTDEASEDGAPHPACATACPVRALEFGPIDELREKYGDTCTIAIFGDETAPNVVINPHRDASKGGELMNPAEVGMGDLEHR